MRGDDEVLAGGHAEHARSGRPGFREQAIPVGRQQPRRRGAAPAAAGSGATPRAASRPTIRARTTAACSPMPPVKTTASREGSAVAAAPMAAAARRSNMASASSASESPASAAASRSRTSAEVPDTPSRPARWSSSSASASGVRWPSRIAQKSTPGSIEPERVPIITPSSGVMPIEVSAERPASTAVTEQPLPRWATTSRGPGRFRSAAARAAAHATEIPWKPNFRTPHAACHSAASGYR